MEKEIILKLNQEDKSNDKLVETKRKKTKKDVIKK